MLHIKPIDAVLVRVSLDGFLMILVTIILFAVLAYSAFRLTLSPTLSCWKPFLGYGLSALPSVNSLGRYRTDSGAAKVIEFTSSPSTSCPVQFFQLQWLPTMP
jgi:hypothetical protein